VVSGTQISTLIVENNLTDAGLLADMLRSMNGVAVSVDHVATLQDAIKCLERSLFTLIILDLSVPDSAGLDTLAAIRAQDPTTPVIVLTGIEDRDVKVFAARMKANAYLVKGHFNSDELFRSIRKTLARDGAGEDGGASEDSLELVVARDAQDSSGTYSEFDHVVRRAVEKERTLLAAAVSGVNDPIIVTDKNSVILYVNPAFSRVTGYTQHEALGKNARFLGSGEHDREFFKAMYATLRAGNAWSGQLVNRRKSGELMRMDVTVTGIRDGQGEIEYYVMVSRDVTDFLELQRQLNKSMRLNAIGQLAGGIAHEFNNVLQVILSSGAALAEETKANQLGLNRYATGIVDAAKRAANLTRQLLVFGRRQPLQVERLDLNSLVEAVVRLLKPLIGEDIVVGMDLTPTLPMVEVDAALIEEIITNLFVNARDAMPEGGEIRIATDRVTLDSKFCKSQAWATEGDFVRLTVTDSGSGMTPEVLDQIFEPFFTTKKEGGSAGMGLASVYGMVKQQKGLIHCDSKLGTRTTFQIYFPAAAALEPDGEEPLAEATGDAADLNARILVAEDDPFVANLSATLLEGAGYRVTIVADGQAAFQELLAASEPYRLVLTDVVMPKMGGIELMALVMASSDIAPKPLFLLSTGYNSGAIEEKISPDMRYEYVQKPYSPADLLMLVRKMLRTE